MKISKDTSFQFVLNVPSEPEISSAKQFSTELLVKAGLKEADTSPDFTISLTIDTVLIPQGAFKLGIEPADARFSVLGGNAEGLRCGLYELMETLGYRWFSPGEEPIVPEWPVTITENNFSNEIIKPSFPFRGLHICAGQHHYDENVALWMSFNKMNRKLTHLEEEDVLGSTLDKLGLKRDTTVHSYDLMISDDAYFHAHPEWFSLVGGKRIKHSGGGQLCLSNSQMRDEFANNVRAFIDKYPQIATLGICPNDGYGWCECDGCLKLDTAIDRQEGTVNGRIADFVYDICAKLAKTHPHIYIGHYSYSNFKDFVFRKDEFPNNLLISFTQFRCFKHSIDDVECKCNSGYFSRLQEIKKRIKNIYIYDYYNYNWGYLPAPIWSIVAKDFKAYYDHGISGFLSEVPGGDSDTYKSFHLAFYITAKMLFDVNADLDHMLNDYCLKRFGKAAPLMRQYLNSLEEALQYKQNCFIKKPADLEELFTPDIQEKCRALLKDALGNADTPFSTGCVKKEVTLFNRWVEITKSRKKYKIPGKISAFPFDSINLDGGFTDVEKWTFVDKISLLPSENKTMLMVFSDNDHLGFIVDCYEHKMEQLVDENSLDASIYGSDNIEVFLANAKNADKCYHFIISHDGRCTAAESFDTTWNWSWKHDAKIETRRMNDRWRILFSLPKQNIEAEKGFFFTAARNRRIDKWEISGLPDGCCFFDIANYIQVD